jgi:hypothetical protein
MKKFLEKDIITMKKFLEKDNITMKKNIIEVTGSISLEGRWIFQGLRVKILLIGCTKPSSILLFMRLMRMKRFLWLLSIWRE